MTDIAGLSSLYCEEMCLVKTGIALTGGNILDLFSVVNGPCQLLAWLIEYTTAVDAACTMALNSDPTVGTSTTVPIALASPDMSAHAIGDFLSVEGDATALVYADVDGGIALPKACTTNKPSCLLVGGLDMILSNSNPTTGACSMYIRWKPLAPGTFITG